MTTKPRSASPIAGWRTSASVSVPKRASASHQPFRAPGTATALAPTTFSRSRVSRCLPISSDRHSYMPAVALPGAVERLSITTWRPSASRIWLRPPPRMPTIIGSATVSAKSEATAASMALPPASRICAPAAEASGWLVTTMPREPLAGFFSQVKSATRGTETEAFMIGLVSPSLRRWRRAPSWSRRRCRRVSRPA